MNTRMMTLLIAVLFAGLLMLNGCKKSEPTPTQTSEHKHSHDDGTTHADHAHEEAAKLSVLNRDDAWNVVCQIAQAREYLGGVFIAFRQQRDSAPQTLVAAGHKRGGILNVFFTEREYPYGHLCSTLKSISRTKVVSYP